MDSDVNVSHISQLLHELQFLSQLLHLPPHGELRINRLQTLVAPQEHCNKHNNNRRREAETAATRDTVTCTQQPGEGPDTLEQPQHHL